MACFLVPAAEAIVTSIIKRRTSHGRSSGKNVAKVPKETQSLRHAASSDWQARLSWLTRMLWGGSGLLAIEHVWHGEVTFIPPFLTAMRNSAGTQVMLHEMATSGLGMAVFVTATWGTFVFAADRIPTLRKLLQHTTPVESDVKGDIAVEEV